MPPPCGGCGRVISGKKWDDSQCRFCWLFQNDARYRKHWGGPASLPNVQTRLTVKCIHRGEELRQQDCPSCAGTVKVKIFGCSLHTECSLGKQLTGTACCANCHDYASEPGR